MTYITEEQMNLLVEVGVNFGEEFEDWFTENESVLMKWYHENQYDTKIESYQRFAYYCANEFMKLKVNTED